MRAGLITDPYFDQALNASAAAANAPGRAWRYTTLFGADTPAAGGSSGPLAAGQDGTLLLVFDGVKMPSRVTVDGVVVGHTSNQFRR